MLSPIAQHLDAIPKDPFSDVEREINQMALVRLWSLACASKHYVKADWMKVDEQLRLSGLLP